MWCDCYAAEHRRGVAGGGWEDADEEADAAANVHAAEHSVTSSSAAAGLDTDRLRTSCLVYLCDCLFINAS